MESLQHRLTEYRCKVTDPAVDGILYPLVTDRQYEVEDNVKLPYVGSVKQFCQLSFDCRQKAVKNIL